MTAPTLQIFNLVTETFSHWAAAEQAAVAPHPVA